MALIIPTISIRFSGTSDPTDISPNGTLYWRKDTDQVFMQQAIPEGAVWALIAPFPGGPFTGEYIIDGTWAETYNALEGTTSSP